MIELLEALPVPDGLEIFIEIPDNLSPEPEEKWEQLQAVIFSRSVVQPYPQLLRNLVRTYANLLLNHPL